MQIPSGSDPPSCLRPFLYPQTGQEAFLAINLVRAAVVSMASPLMRGTLVSIILGRGVEWFALPESERGPLLSSLCPGEDSNCRIY